MNSDLLILLGRKRKSRTLSIKNLKKFRRLITNQRLIFTTKLLIKWMKLTQVKSKSGIATLTRLLGRLRLKKRTTRRLSLKILLMSLILTK